MSLSKESVLNYELGNLYKFTANKLFNDPAREEQDGVILAMALAYNDLKGLFLFYEVLQEHPPKTKLNSVSARAGEYSGLNWQVFKYISSVLNEIIQLLVENKQIFSQNYIQAAVNKLGPEEAKAWELFTSLMTNQNLSEDLKKLRNLMVRIRNNAGFHYYDPDEIIAGYKQAFFNSAKRPDGMAYFCRGNTLQHTRFHFADAAVEEYLLNKLNNFSLNHSQEVRTFMTNVKQAMHSIIYQYLKQIQADITLVGSGNDDF